MIRQDHLRNCRIELIQKIGAATTDITLQRKKLHERRAFSEDLVQGRENLVLVPFLKHLDITSHYARKVEQGDGSWLSSRDLLKDNDFETRREYGLKVLRDYGVLK